LTYVAAILATACFGIALRWLGVVAAAGRAVATSREAAESMRDPALSDLEKEHRVQKASLSLMRSFVSIVARGTGAFLLAIVPVLALQLSGIVQASAVSHLLVTWQGILLTCVVMTVAFLLRPAH